MTKGQIAAIIIGSIAIAGIVTTIIVMSSSKANAKPNTGGGPGSPSNPNGNNPALPGMPPTDPNYDANNVYQGAYQTGLPHTGGPILIKQGPTKAWAHPFLKTFDDESDAIAAGLKHGDHYLTRDTSIWAVNSI